MSMEHKAFVFDHNNFDRMLRPILESALASGNCEELVDYISGNPGGLTDPYEGEPLDANWEDMLEVKDAHQYGDFALTRFYDSRDDVGLGGSWEEVGGIWANEFAGQPSPVLGLPLGCEPNLFDPGKMGSYFQSENMVAANLDAVIKLMDRTPSVRSLLEPSRNMLATAVDRKRGLYVTF